MKRFEGNNHFIISSDTVFLSNCDHGILLGISGFPCSFQNSCPRMECEATQHYVTLSGLDLVLARMLIAELQLWSISDAWTNILYYGCDWYRWINLEFT